jgi:hypothetical protein
MITNRFNSSGLASARVDSFARIGVSAVVRYAPRGWSDLKLFVVVSEEEGVELPPFSELLDDVRANERPAE